MKLGVLNTQVINPFACCKTSLSSLWKYPTLNNLIVQCFPHFHIPSHVPGNVFQMLVELCQARCCDHCPAEPASLRG